MGLFHKFRSNVELKTPAEIVKAAEVDSGKTFTGTAVIVGKASVFSDGKKECVSESVKEYATLEETVVNPKDPNGREYSYKEINGLYWMTENYKYIPEDTTGIKQYNDFVYYHYDVYKTITPPSGWRLPTYDEFVAMIIAEGATYDSTSTSTYQYYDNYAKVIEDLIIEGGGEYKSSQSGDGYDRIWLDGTTYNNTVIYKNEGTSLLNITKKTDRSLLLRFVKNA